ncbi:MAG: type II toxin -antitoxin system TacA 1-like antitoxin [Methylobacter sp.]|jgi:uncharacterized protein (DUF1778 family)
MATENNEQDLTEKEQTHFSSDDWQMFFAMVDNPPEPTERMKRAALLYKRIIAADED